MTEGKLEVKISKVVFSYFKEMKQINDILNEAKTDILALIKEYEDEEIPDDIIRAKIVELFGNS